MDHDRTADAVPPSTAGTAGTVPPRVTGAVGEMAFPRAARLELDELLEQLVSRAHDVQQSQGRLRGLLAAYLKLAGAVDLEDVLRHIVAAARDLVSARYAALGVVRDGRLVRFLHLGMPADEVERIGALPEGKGLLGRLMDYPQPLRLADIGSHLSSVGLPPHHPPMRSFLGVPIQVGGRVFGNLYLTEKQGAAEFSADDEELVQALAAAAALAIDNATLFDQVRRGQSWQGALVEITTELVRGTDPESILRDLVHHAITSARATGAGVSIPTDDGQEIDVTVAEGTYEGWLGTRTRLDGSIAGVALAAATAILIPDAATDPRTADRIGPGAGIGPTLAVPIAGEEGPLGVLSVSRGTGSEPFDEADQELLAVFASRAALAMRLAATRRNAEAIDRIEDRGHIADQLREGVISRLYGAGLSVQALLPRVTSAAVRESLLRHIDELDAVIADIRTAVFTLRERDR